MKWQCGDFAGSEAVSCAEDTERWAETMENDLWVAFLVHGLDTTGMQLPGSSTSSSSSSMDITGDEASLTQHPKTQVASVQRQEAQAY